ncbi:hypothetical protein [Nakamurella deserti]|uniref:hypothetical protein n=1 Tax=Nakamurella deserti TaxID=2164074 RepID=UPI000DBE5AA0|nr:hypothetical protein [Nakamurella deserti]
MTAAAAAADDALDRLWGDFFRLRAAVDSGMREPPEVLVELRALHAAAGTTGSSHVPVFRAEVRAEITRVKGAG